jgi:hypothetical protein
VTPAEARWEDAFPRRGRECSRDVLRDALARTRFGQGVCTLERIGGIGRSSDRLRGASTDKKDGTTSSSANSGRNAIGAIFICGSGNCVVSSRALRICCLAFHASSDLEAGLTRMACSCQMMSVSGVLRNPLAGAGSRVKRGLVSEEGRRACMGVDQGVL